MKDDLMNRQVLHDTTRGTGRYQRLADLGFRPAYMDFATLRIYPCAFADGRPSPDHTRAGLPDEAVSIRGPAGEVLAVKPTLIPGFVRGGYFFTLDRAERMAADWPARRD